MRCCEHCGKELVGGYSNRRFCNGNCRSYASKTRKKEAALAVAQLAAAQADLMLAEQVREFRVRVEELRRVAPATAATAAELFDRAGSECGEVIQKMLNAAYHEFRALA
jgi:hypothetical protein